MKDYSYLIGEQFGLLTVVEKDEEMSKEKHRQYYKCNCGCGNSKSIRAEDIPTYYSCGCMRYSEPHYKDITGQVFGNLIAIRYIYTIKKKAYWLCNCSCGKECVVQAGNLSSGHTTTCGHCFSDASKPSSLNKHCRNLINWHKIVDLDNEKCFLTGRTDCLEIHHLTPLNVIIKNILLDFDNNVDLLCKDSNIKLFDEKILRAHAQENVCVILNKDIHSLFHKLYGYTNCSKEDFFEFSKSFFSTEEPFPPIKQLYGINNFT